MNLDNNPLFRLLESLGLADKATVSVYHPQTRDREDVQVLRCSRSGVIFLSGTEHVDLGFYETKPDLPGEMVFGKLVPTPPTEDDTRRARQFGSLIRNKRWLDLGTGAGQILHLLAPEAAEIVAVEPNRKNRERLQGEGFDIVATAKALEGRSFDVVTLFHVLEHLSDPLGELSRIRSMMAPGGTLLVEVPHARDALIDRFGCRDFRDFTFWSEHLILHTRESLTRLLEKVGFTGISVEGFQRFPLANHLYWLAQSKPGGHEQWKDLNTPKLESAYGELLDSCDMTDTLVVQASC